MKRKHIIIPFLIIIIIFLLLPVFKIPVIGSISGAENEHLNINKDTYITEELHPSYEKYCNFSSKDKGIYIGSVSNGKDKMRVYTIKNNKNRDILYVLCDWEGNFYIKQ